MNIKQRLKKTFLELIAINGVYPNEEQISCYVEKRLGEAEVSSARDTFGNIIVKMSGVGESVLLSTHLDIPEEAPRVRYTIVGDRIQSDGSGILGADPKTGLAILIEFAAALAKGNPSEHSPIELMLTRGEETGLLGARNLDYTLIESKMGLVLDEDGPVTQVVTQAPAFGRIDATFIGKVVHPREPEKGINALQMACEAVTKIPCGYSTPGVTWNIGLFQAGTARNSVPGKAVANGELRGYETAIVQSELARIQDIFHKIALRYGGECQFDIALEFEGYKLERNHELFEKLERTFGAMHIKPNYYATFGGSDANIFNSKRITTVPIGSGYFNAHEYTEYADLDAMERIYNFLTAFVRVTL